MRYVLASRVELLRERERCQELGIVLDALAFFVNTNVAWLLMLPPA